MPDFKVRPTVNGTNITIASDLTTKADLASPTFTGTPAAPTAAIGTNTTQLATTAFVAAANAADQGTSFPSSPATGRKFLRTDFRAWFLYDGSVWRQISEGSFDNTFPSSPVTGLRVWLTDYSPHRLFYYTGSAWALIVGSVGVRVYNSTDISLPNNTPYPVTFNSERADADAIHSTISNTDRLTCVIPGWYTIGAGTRYDTNATGVRTTYIELNGTTLIALDTKSAVSGLPTDLGLTTIYRLAVGDYVRMFAYHNITGGGSLALKAAGNYSPEFWMTWTSG